MPKCISIERTDDPGRAHWIPLLDKKGRYQLVSRKVPYPARNTNLKATFVDTLEKAGDLINNHDHGIRMAPPGARRGDYIYPKNLRVNWA